MLDNSKPSVAASPHGLCRIPENSDVRKERLTAEGNWEAFCEKKQRYRDQDWTPKEADIMAHHDFPPSGLVETSEGVEIRTEPAKSSDDVVDSGAVEADGSDESSEPAEVDLSTPDALRDADWVYSNMNVKGLERKDAPSQAAWNMLSDFGRNPTTRIKFYEKVLEPLLKRARVGETYSDDGRELITLCERKRAEFVAEARREREWPAELEDRLDELCEESDAMKWFVDRGRRLIDEAVA